MFEQTGDFVRLSFKQVMREFTDLSFGLRLTRGEEEPGRDPQVFEYVPCALGQGSIADAR
ncbi:MULTISPECIES: hypothetical protein [unclassified Streptomyces]|uniref:hypothetical protein n=1 Tax=unclassified Streptomyces TaxID=2593676 RepID=UPI002E32D66B|nr:hypothetical protein [Streptomyces sp. NBC_01261]WSX55615.1 hypothetical protein OG504_03905 [Streptomyces sp. NBC_00986]